MLDITETSHINTPVRVEFRYRRPWKKDAQPWKPLRLVVNTISEKQQVL